MEPYDHPEFEKSTKPQLSSKEEAGGIEIIPPLSEVELAMNDFQSNIRQTDNGGFHQAAQKEGFGWS
jgi:hypothetical protein